VYERVCGLVRSQSQRSGTVGRRREKETRPSAYDPGTVQGGRRCWKFNDRGKKVGGGVRTIRRVGWYETNDKGGIGGELRKVPLRNLF